MKSSILGLDIEPNFTSSYKTFSIAILYNEEIILKKTNVDLREIFFLIRKYNVDLIATDNIFELATNERQLKKLFLYFPSKTKIVQITGNPASPVDTLVGIARKYGFEVPSKLQPLDTAILAAKLASMGLGYPIKLQEDETFIVVCKALEPSAGGMSMDRYKRNIYANIQQTINEIKSLLNSNGMKYDFFYGKSSKEGGIFIVYSPKDIVRKVIKPYKGYGIQVKVLPVIKSSSLFSEITQHSTKPLIVSVDPGITVGLAILDLDGSLIALESFKYAGLNSIIEYIIQKGKPVIITSDKCKPSNMVNKLATKFGSLLYLPNKDLSIEEKRNLVSTYLDMFDIHNIRINPHMRDALAPAYLAFKKYYPTLIQIKNELKDLLIDKNEIYKVFEKVIVENKTIKEAVEEIILKDNKEEDREDIYITTKHKFDPQVIESLKRKLNELERTIKLQEIKILDQSNIISKLKEEVEKLRSESYIRIKRDFEISSLKKRIDELIGEIKRREEEIMQEKFLVKKIVQNIIKLKSKELEVYEILDGLENVQQNNITNDTIVVKKVDDLDNKILNKLTLFKIKLIITLAEVPNNVIEVLKNQGILILNVNVFDYFKVENIIFLNPEEIREKLYAYIDEIAEREKKEKERIINFLKGLKDIKA